MKPRIDTSVPEPYETVVKLSEDTGSRDLDLVREWAIGYCRSDFYGHVGAIHRQVLQEIEDRKVFGTLEQATRALLDERALKDWTGRLRKGVLLTWLPSILLVSPPIALALIWALS